LLSEGIVSPEKIFGIMIDKIAKFFAALGNAVIMTAHLCAAATLILVLFVGTVATPSISTVVIVSAKLDNIGSKTTHVDDSGKISLSWNDREFYILRVIDQCRVRRMLSSLSKALWFSLVEVDE
jgi:hypothetical protein